MARTVKILGLKSLNRKLTKLPQAAEAAIRKAMATGADEIVALMKSLVAVDSGALKASIGWTWGDKPKGSVSIATVKSKDGSLRITIFAGNDKIWYARLVEFGAPKHIAGGLFKGLKHPGAPAQPFFFVSFRALRRRTKSRITRAITKSARQAVADGSNS